MFGIFTTIFKYKEKESPDKLGLFPEQVHVDAMPERRLYVMLPQRSSAPQLFYIDHYFSQIERAQPMEIDYPVGNLINEEHITNYIMLRYLITNDYDELTRRWGPGSYVYWYSSPFIFDEFTRYDAKFNMLQFRNKNMMRDVEVDWIRPLGTGLWQTQFRTIDYTPKNPTPDVNLWRAVMRLRFVRFPNRSHDDALKNPFGFLITNFSLSYLGAPNASQHYLEESKRITKELFFR